MIYVKGQPMITDFFSFFISVLEIMQITMIEIRLMVHPISRIFLWFFIYTMECIACFKKQITNFFDSISNSY